MNLKFYTHFLRFPMFSTVGSSYLTNNNLFFNTRQSLGNNKTKCSVHDGVIHEETRQSSTWPSIRWCNPIGRSMTVREVVLLPSRVMSSFIVLIFPFSLPYGLRVQETDRNGVLLNFKQESTLGPLCAWSFVWQLRVLAPLAVQEVWDLGGGLVPFSVSTHLVSVITCIVSVAGDVEVIHLNTVNRKIIK